MLDGPWEWLTLLFQDKNKWNYRTNPIAYISGGSGSACNHCAIDIGGDWPFVFHVPAKTLQNNTKYTTIKFSNAKPKTRTNSWTLL